MQGLPRSPLQRVQDVLEALQHDRTAAKAARGRAAAEHILPYVRMWARMRSLGLLLVLICSLPISLALVVGSVLFDWACLLAAGKGSEVQRRLRVALGKEHRSVRGTAIVSGGHIALAFLEPQVDAFHHTFAGPVAGHVSADCNDRGSTVCLGVWCKQASCWLFQGRRAPKGCTCAGTCTGQAGAWCLWMSTSALLPLPLAASLHTSTTTFLGCWMEIEGRIGSILSVGL